MDLSKSMNYEEYLKLATHEQRVAFEETVSKTILSELTLKKLYEIKKDVNLVVFSENYCPDCVVTLPFLLKMQEACSNVKIHILKREGNEQLLKEMVGESRIPTIVFFNEKFEPKSFYIEFPDEFKKKLIGLHEEYKKRLIQELRDGKYSYLIEQELIEHIERACC